MRPLIPPRDYEGSEAFCREQDLLFSTLWQLAGFTHELANHQDYVTVSLGGKSVVVQNFDGEMKAFANVCSHRFARIRASPRGNGPLRCPYHGWAYNAEGVPFSIPSRPRFDDLTPAMVQSLALEEYSVETCGNLVFVRAQRGKGSLRQFLGECFETLERMGAGMGELIDRNEMVIRANWKVNVENTLESYHVSQVHPTTFQKVGAKGVDFGFQGIHSSWRTPIDPAMTAQMGKLVASIYRARSFSVDGYFHQLIFPNLTVATTYGTSFAVQRFEPLGPGETRFVSDVFLARPDEGARNAGALLDLMRESVKSFNRAVFEEDRLICERVQQGLAQATQPGLLSEEEARVLQFQKAYRQYVPEEAISVRGGEV